MRLESKDSILNIGDTSFRRKKYMEEYKEILTILNLHMKEYKSWSRNLDSQKDFYQTVIMNTDYFDRSEKEDAKLAKRARTLTNSMVKAGLIDTNRFITETGYSWLNDEIKNKDTFEKALAIDTDNLVFFRQWSKLRLYGPEGNKFFSPFIYTLKFLTKYSNVPLEHYLSIIHSISPDLSLEYVEDSILKYELVESKKISFEVYMEKYVLDNKDFMEKIDEKILVKIVSENTDKDLFYKYFYNRKSPDKIEKYQIFVESLMKFRKNQNVDNLKELTFISKNSAVKKAFGYNKLPFKLQRKFTSNSVHFFNNDNKNNILLNGTAEDIYFQFLDSKRYDLLREYKDMTVRLFNLSGVIDFNNSLVNLPYNELFNNLFDNNNIPVVGESSFDNHEGKLNGTFFINSSFLEFLNINESSVENELSELSNKLNLSSVSDLTYYYDQMRIDKINNLINSKFNVEQTINILQHIDNRKDTEVNELVTHNASVPTIFEYILSIAWYHISNKNFNVLNSFNLSLDAALLPLSHATGLQGDIEIKDHNPAVILEATLMDKNNQKRNELEPVIRHTTNFSIEQKPKKTYGIFVANQIDDNVANLFRACKTVELQHSRTDELIKGVNIYAFTIKEIIKMLEEDIKIDKILTVFDEDERRPVFDEDERRPVFVEMGWRNKINYDIFS